MLSLLRIFFKQQSEGYAAATAVPGTTCGYCGGQGPLYKDMASYSLDDIHSVLAMYLYAVWRDGNRREVIK